jgi:hypothetical protein
MSFSVFISHSVSPAELGIVYAISEEAARRGMQPYIPDRQWNPEEQLPHRIYSALQSTDICVAVATQFGTQLPWVNAEIAGALAKPTALIAVLDSTLPVQDPQIESARVTIMRDNVPATLARALQKIELVRVEQTQKTALTWLVVGGLLFLLTQGDK